MKLDPEAFIQEQGWMFKRQGEEGAGVTPEELGLGAVHAILDGTRLTLCLPKGELWPQGWPKGELLSESEIGRNYSFDPLRILAAMQRAVAHKAPGEGEGTRDETSRHG